LDAAGIRLGADSSCGVILANPPGSKDSKGNWALAGARGVLFLSCACGHLGVDCQLM